MLTRHAEVRRQQRGIPWEVVNVFLTYGVRRRHRGAEVCFMDKRSRSRVEHELGSDAYRRMADRLDTYLVVADDGQVVTAAKRLGRLKFYGRDRRH